MKLNIPVAGTMAHSFVTAFNSLEDVPEYQLNSVNIKQLTLAIREKLKFTSTKDGELAAFLAFAKGFPDKLSCLVDTYDTLKSGVPNFICVAYAL